MNWLGDAPTSSDIDPKELKRDTSRAIQAILRGMDSKLRFDTVEELLVLKEDAALARKRSIIGFFAAGAATGAAWRYAYGKRSALAAAASGALAGMTYGMFTVREKFFLDLLSLPDNVSPFAREAHKIVDSTMPNSVIHREIQARRREKFPSLMGVDIIWTEPPPPFSAGADSKDQPSDDNGGDDPFAFPSRPPRVKNVAQAKPKGPPGAGRGDEGAENPWADNGGGLGEWGDGIYGGGKDEPPKPTT